MGLQDLKTAGSLLSQNAMMVGELNARRLPRNRLGGLALLGVFLFVVGEVLADPSPSGIHSVHPTATPSLSPAELVSPSPEAPPVRELSIKEMRARIEAKRAELDRQKKAMRARQKQEMREFDRTKKREYTEFFESEKQKRRQFFKQHHNGPERRDYIKDFIQRREQFLEAQKASKEQKRQEQSDEIKAFEKKTDELLGKSS